MSSKVLLAVCILVAVAAAVPAPGGWGAGPFMPQWLATAPWMPKWTECKTIGSACVDCNTKMVCTKIGGMQRACTDPTMPYCNLGECSATPAEGCAPAVPATTA